MSDATAVGVAAAGVRGGTRSRENTRARLLGAAYEVFSEVGMDGASVEMICERAGFSRGAFYSNFESKDELFLALITDMADQKLEQVAGRVRLLNGRGVLDTNALVGAIVGESLAGHMEPGLVGEIRAQALRDERMAVAYLTWMDSIIARVESIVVDITTAHRLRLRMPTADVARLFVEVSDDTAVRAAISGLDVAETAAVLQRRIAQLALALIDADPGDGAAVSSS